MTNLSAKADKQPTPEEEKLGGNIDNILVDLVQAIGFQVTRDYLEKGGIWEGMSISNVNSKNKALKRLSQELAKVQREATKDTQRLDFLDSLSGEYTNKVILRISRNGRGWRLHETSGAGAEKTVREAIDTFIQQSK